MDGAKKKPSRKIDLLKHYLEKYSDHLATKKSYEEIEKLDEALIARYRDANRVE
jgi:hypothetical protein